MPVTMIHDVIIASEHSTLNLRAVTHTVLARNIKSQSDGLLGLPWRKFTIEPTFF